MTPRTDIAFLWIEDPFEDVMKTVMDKGYSRLPVYRTSPDEIEGFLFIKDLLPYIDHTSFDWQTLIKKPFFVPENKMIDDLLQEFQHAKIHLAIVVDEYGGTSGLVTLEDILEEMEMLSSLPSQINMLEDASLFLAEQKKQSTMQRKSSEKKDVEKNNSSNQTTTQSNTKSIDIASLNESEKNIYSTLLEADSISMDRLVELTSMPIHKINSTLMTLELKKIIKRQGPSICRA
jgi:Mg2+/Co2+ transporter CorB